MQHAATAARRSWNDGLLSRKEKIAMNTAGKTGQFWLVNLLRKQAIGRHIDKVVKLRTVERFGPERISYNRVGVDIVDKFTGLRYEILSGTIYNRALHTRRMRSEQFRLIEF